MYFLDQRFFLFYRAIHKSSRRSWSQHNCKSWFSAEKLHSKKVINLLTSMAAKFKRKEVWNCKGNSSLTSGMCFGPKLFNICINGVKKEWKHHWIKVTQNQRPENDTKSYCWVSSMPFTPGNSVKGKIEKKEEEMKHACFLFHRIHISKI